MGSMWIMMAWWFPICSLRIIPYLFYFFWKVIIPYFYQAEENQILAIWRVLRLIELVSRLKMNLGKSSMIDVNTSEEKVSARWFYGVWSVKAPYEVFGSSHWLRPRSLALWDHVVWVEIINVEERLFIPRQQTYSDHGYSAQSSRVLYVRLQDTCACARRLEKLTKDFLWVFFKKDNSFIDSEKKMQKGGVGVRRERQSGGGRWLQNQLLFGRQLLALAEGFWKSTKLICYRRSSWKYFFRRTLWLPLLAWWYWERLPLGS